MAVTKGTRIWVIAGQVPIVKALEVEVAIGVIGGNSIITSSIIHQTYQRKTGTLLLTRCELYVHSVLDMPM